MTDHLTKDMSLTEKLRDIASEFRTGRYIPDTCNEAAREIERLRAALGSIARDELAEAWNADSAGGGPEGWQDDYWRVVNIARQAISHCAVEPENNVTEK